MSWLEKCSGEKKYASLLKIAVLICTHILFLIKVANLTLYVLLTYIILLYNYLIL
jgi:hypothetical protein